MTSNASMHVTGADTLVALLLCGLLGVLGQGIRAAVGLKSSNMLSSTPTEQSAFSAAYFLLSLMIGFIAGVLAGLVVGLSNFVAVDLSNIKMLLGVAASGYAGADFIENSMSIVIPAGTTSTGNVPPATEASLTTNVTPLSASVLANAPRPDNSQQLSAALSIVAPGVSTGTWVPILMTAFTKFDCNNNKRISAAIGQFLVEAGSRFQEVVENLNYTTAERIAQVFPSAFPTVESTEPYVGKPEALANRAYANKLGNGDEASGDGYRFRGRGLIQLTGRSEYAEFGATVGKSAEDAASYCETAEGAAMSGCWYLSSQGCLPLADSWQISAITRKVNGSAMLGNTQRIAYADAMLKHLGG